jgi:hypothetical protein
VGKFSRMMWAPLALAVLYTSLVLWQRHASETTPQSPRLEQDPLAAYGKGVKILQFYGPAGPVSAGQKAMVCYGVLNATSVKLDPPVERVWPALSRCFDFAPARNTRYTLTAEGENHNTVTESIDVEVKR